MDEIKDVRFWDNGPHAIPLLDKFVSLDLGDQLQEWAVAQFQREDGPLIYVPISSRALAPLIAALQIWQLKIAKRESCQSQKH